MLKKQPSTKSYFCKNKKIKPKKIEHYLGEQPTCYKNAVEITPR